MLNILAFMYPNCQRTNMNENFISNKKQDASWHLVSSGGGERVRTDDLLRARQALSQLSYTPNNINHLILTMEN